jgi:Hint domain-containing protein
MAQNYLVTSSSVYNTASGTKLGISDFDSNIGSPDTDDGFWNLNDERVDPADSFEYSGYFITNGHLFLVFNDATQTLIYSTTAGALPPNDYPVSLASMPALITTPLAICFAKDTRIATPTGETAVDALSIGDTIINSDGTCVAVKWIGCQTVHKLFSGPRMQPVRIRAGILGDDLPHSDLIVTADHGMIIDGLVINASALVNGTTIDFVRMSELPDQVTYYHIETENHDIILANGARAETFVDVVSRSVFDNYQEYLDLYGAERIITEMDRPRISSKRLVPESIKARLGIGDGIAEFGLDWTA